MVWILKNNVRSTLSNAVDATTATFRLNTATAPYRDPFNTNPTTAGGRLGRGVYTLVDDLNAPGNVETVAYDAVASISGIIQLVGITRGYDGTSARAWPVSTPCFQGFTNQIFSHLQELKAPIKNLLHNAGFYADTIENTTSTASQTHKLVHVMDRWFLEGFFNNGNAGAHIQVTSSSADSYGERCMKIECAQTDTSLTASSFASFSQDIPAQNILSLGFGKSFQKVFTFSYWAKTNRTGTYSVFFRDAFGTRGRLEDATLSQSGAWQFKRHFVTADSNTTWATTNTIGLRVGWSLMPTTTYGTSTAGVWMTGNFYGKPTGPSLFSSTGNYLQIYHPAVRLGDDVQDFDQEEISETVERVQRYHINGHIYHNWFAGFSGENMRIWVPFRNQLRIDPPTFIRLSGIISLTNCATPTFSNTRFTGTQLSIVADATGQVDVQVLFAAYAEFRS
jgi:hypothetical protein